jgi:hypothetical protein
VEVRFCDEQAFCFSWIVVDEQATRTSHALVADGRVWLVDPVDWPEAIDRVVAAGTPAGIVQLLDRHNRDCRELAQRLAVPHLVTPAAVPGSPFELRPVKRSRHWRETALWWPERSTLVVAEAIGTNRFFSPADGAGVHLLLRLRPPRAPFQDLEPEHLLVGHGEGLHGPATAAALRRALDDARPGLPRALLGLPGLAADAIRRRRS